MNGNPNKNTDDLVCIPEVEGLSIECNSCHRSMPVCCFDCPSSYLCKLLALVCDRSFDTTGSGRKRVFLCLLGILCA